MIIIELSENKEIERDTKNKGAFVQFGKLLFELRKRDLPEGLVALINKEILEVNSVSGPAKDFRKVIKKAQTGIIKMLEKELKLVPKSYYRNLWMPLGMASFGIPLGAAFGASMGNMALLGLGMLIGVAVGLAVGSGMDKKALAQGRQLDVEIKY